MLLQDLDRHVLAERQVAAVMLAAGATGMSLPSAREARDLFDAALQAEPTLAAVDSETADLRRALGM